jgi:hypothetical protein
MVFGSIIVNRLYEGQINHFSLMTGKIFYEKSDDLVPIYFAPMAEPIMRVEGMSKASKVAEQNIYHALMHIFKS